MEIDLEKIIKHVSDKIKTDDDILISSIFDSKAVSVKGLTDEEKLCAIIYAHNTLGNDTDIYYPMTKKKIKKHFNWTDYKIRKLAESIDDIIVMPMQDEDGYLCGKGYVVKSLVS